MAKRVVNDEALAAVADSIRDKTSKAEALTFPEGFSEGVGEVFAAGEKSQYLAFWTAYMGNLNNAYNQKEAFAGTGWDDTTFDPPVSFNPTNRKNCEMMFKDSRISDLAGILKRNGVVFDFSGCTSFDTFAQSSQIVHFPVLDMAASSRFSYTFNLCSKMVSIEKWIISPAGTQTFRSVFDSCAALQDLVVEGVIGQSGLDLHWSTKLSKASIESVIAALSTATSGLSVTLSKTAVEAAFADDAWAALANTRANWTINLV